MEKSVLRVALPQILAVMVKNTVLLELGMTIGFSTILIPSVSGSEANDVFSLTQGEVSWISKYGAYKWSTYEFEFCF